MRPVPGDVELTSNELKVLTALTGAPSLTEAARRTGFSRKYVRDVTRRLSELGILVFFPNFSKMGLSLIFLLSDEDYIYSIIKEIPHFFLHLRSKSGNNMYVALADKRSLPEFSRKAFGGKARLYSLGDVRGWNTAFINFLAERGGLKEEFTVNEVSGMFIEYLVEKFREKGSLKRFLASLRIKDNRRSVEGVYYVEMDEYDITILDSKLADAFISISSIAKRHGLYRQVLHYHYVNHVLPVWKYNIVMWKGVGKRFEPRLIVYSGEDVDIVEEFFRTMYPTVFTARLSNQPDGLVVLTYLPEEKEETLRKLSSHFSLRFSKVFEEELILSYYASRPFSRIYGHSGWRSIYEDYLEAARK